MNQEAKVICKTYLKKKRPLTTEDINFQIKKTRGNILKQIHSLTKARLVYSRKIRNVSYEFVPTDELLKKYKNEKEKSNTY